MSIFARAEITVRDGKGEKDRLTMLPHSLASALEVQIDAVRQLHEQDLKRGYGEVYLPYALEKKYKNAARDLLWQYVFPADDLSVDPRAGKTRRHHISEQSVQRGEDRVAHSRDEKEWNLPHVSAQLRDSTCLRTDTTLERCKSCSDTRTCAPR